MPIYGEEAQTAKRQDKRGILGLGYGAVGHGGVGLQGNLAGVVGTGYAGTFIENSFSLSEFLSCL